MNIFYRLWNRFAESVSIRTFRRVYFSVRQDMLCQQTMHSSEPGISPVSYFPESELIVSLTTHGKRLADAWLAIESVMQGTVLPNRIILWLDEKLQNDPLPVLIQKQQNRGLEIHYTKDLGPYTKLVPTLTAYPGATIVTIDDDILYPVDMLESLLNASRRHQNAICAHRVVEMTRDCQGQITPLRSWIQTKKYDQISEDFFYEAVAGVLYPPHCLASETTDQSLFLSLSPTADDIWFNAMARKKGTPIIAVNTHSEHPYLWVNESLQADALHVNNNNPRNPLNDVQLKAVFDYFHL